MNVRRYGDDDPAARWHRAISDWARHCARMLLPNGDFAEVPLEKIVDYLLSRAHPEGAGKAAFFIAHGFASQRPQQLIDALKMIARTCEVMTTTTSEHGVKHIVDGLMAAPDGRTPSVRTVWIVEPDRLVPRLVTAFPGPKIHGP